MKTFRAFDMEVIQTTIDSLVKILSFKKYALYVFEFIENCV